jgi:hypothetical protein
MWTSTIIVWPLLALVVDAEHIKYRSTPRDHRRFNTYARLVEKKAPAGQDGTSGSIGSSSSGACTLGEWKCDGQILQRLFTSSVFARIRRWLISACLAGKDIKRKKSVFRADIRVL